MLLLLLLSLCVSPATVLKITPCHARSHKGLPEKELWDCWCNIFVGCIPFLSPTSVKVLKRQKKLKLCNMELFVQVAWKSDGETHCH